MSAGLQSTPQQPFPFLNLPAELRNRIHCFALASASVLHGGKTKQPPLTRVSRQIRSESLGIFYTKNWFNMSCPWFNPSAFMNFYQGSRNNGCLVRQVVFPKLNFPTPPNRMAETMENIMTWLEKFYTRQWSSRWTPSGHRAKLDPRFIPTKVERLFDLARLLRRQNLSWEVAKPMLLVAIDGMNLVPVMRV